jgi:hypothetical protein
MATESAPAFPPGFDAAAFERQAKVNFIRLQAAHDAGNLDDIREFTTPEMYAEIKLDIDERHGAGSRTEVVTLNAQVLEAVEEDQSADRQRPFHRPDPRRQRDRRALRRRSGTSAAPPTARAAGWSPAFSKAL